MKALRTSLINILRKTYYLGKTIQLSKYEKFSQNEREILFSKILKYFVLNRPLNGNYFEFGCHSGRTFREALKNFGSKSWFNSENDTKFYAFDSFEGLPDVEENKEKIIWGKGKFKTDIEEFRKILNKSGYKNENYELIKGFYHNTLNDNLKIKLLKEGHASLIYVDCDLYYSTVPVLNFIKDFIVDGTLIVFDDWFCFNGRADKGQQKAFYEFQKNNPQFKFVPYISNSEVQVFIINK